MEEGCDRCRGKIVSSNDAGCALIILALAILLLAFGACVRMGCT